MGHDPYFYSHDTVCVVRAYVYKMSNLCIKWPCHGSYLPCVWVLGVYVQVMLCLWVLRACVHKTLCVWGLKAHVQMVLYLVAEGLSSHDVIYIWVLWVCVHMMLCI